MVILAAACVGTPTDTGKAPWVEPSPYTLVVSGPIGAVAIDLGTEESGPLGEDGVCILDDAGTVTCAGPVPAPPEGTILASLSVSGTGGCGLLGDGGAMCWGRPAEILTHDLTDVVDISVLPTLASGEEEVCAATASGAAWCEGEQYTFDVEGEGYVEVSAAEYGVGVKDADGRLWWRSFDVTESIQRMDEGVDGEVVSWSANSSFMIGIVDDAGDLYYTAFVGPYIAPRVDAEGVAKVSVAPYGGLCWIDQSGGLGQEGGAHSTEDLVAPTEGYVFTGVGCTIDSMLWAITDDGRVARLAWESAPDMPF